MVAEKVEIVPFDPRTASDREWAGFHAYRRVRHEETYPEDPLSDDKTEEKWMKQSDPQSEERRFAVVEEGNPDVVIGWLYFSVFRQDAPSYEANKHFAWVDLAVLAPYRRRGIGGKLLAKVADLAKERNRSLIIFGSDEDDGKGFIKAIDAQVAQRTRESRLHLDQVDWQMVENWVEEGPTRSPESALQWFTNRIEDDIIEDFCRVLTEVINQAPRDELDIGDEIVTPETRRKWEARIADVGGTRLTAITREADGAISGLTEMGYFPDEETIIRQFMTGVKDAYRGRGLGKWLKAAMLLRVREEFPQVKVVGTGNATSNAAMLSINERLGFKPHKEGIMAQITLESLERYLSRKGLRDR